MALDSGLSELGIVSERSSDAFFLVLPESDTQLLIEPTAVWSLELPTGEGVRLSQMLRGSVNGKTGR